MNITKLKIWPELQKLGFEVINFRVHGKIVHKGCALRQKHIDIQGKEFHSDIICIEPHDFKHDTNRYHITGNIKTPYWGTTYYYDYGNTKKERHELIDHMNEFIAANEIMKYVELMLDVPNTGPAK